MVHYITTNGIGNAWVAAELKIMDELGVPHELHSLRGPHQNFFGSHWADDLNRRTQVIYPIAPLALCGSLLLAPLLFGGRFLAVLFNALFGPRESWKARGKSIAHALVACHWARRLRGRDVSLIHAQWIHSSGTVGMYGAWLLGVPFSFTGHAVDLFRDRVALRDKIRRAEFIVCISDFHRRFYLTHGARPEQLHVIHCGIDIQEFQPDWAARGHRKRRRIVSVGRLVEKKGFGRLIEASRLLKDRGVDFETEIVGDGPLEGELKALIARLDVGDRVILKGRAVLQEELPALLRGADVYAQPCVWSKDDDVDGTPRTLMEAMACGVPSVATCIAGLPDIVEHDRSGLLVLPNDVKGLSEALERLLGEESLASRLARGGREQILQRFQIRPCLEPLAALFQEQIARRPATATRSAPPPPLLAARTRAT